MTPMATMALQSRHKPSDWGINLVPNHQLRNAINSTTAPAAKSTTHRSEGCFKQDEPGEHKEDKDEEAWWIGTIQMR